MGWKEKKISVVFRRKLENTEIQQDKTQKNRGRRDRTGVVKGEEKQKKQIDGPAYGRSSSRR